MMDPKRKTFQSLVEEVRRPGRASQTTRRTFRGAAQSVLLEREREESEERDQTEELSDDLDQVSGVDSEDSDWSDDEMQELEKMFGAMSERGKMAERRRRATDLACVQSTALSPLRRLFSLSLSPDRSHAPLFPYF